MIFYFFNCKINLTYFANIMLSSFQFAYFLILSSKVAVSTLVNFCSFPVIFLRSFLQNKHTLGKIPLLDEVAGDVKFDRVIWLDWSCWLQLSLFCLCFRQGSKFTIATRETREYHQYHLVAQFRLNFALFWQRIFEHFESVSVLNNIFVKHDITSWQCRMYIKSKFKKMTKAEKSQHVSYQLKLIYWTICCNKK